MLNQTILVGRITKEVELEKNEGKKMCKITLAVTRSYKNADGVYETDFIPVVVLNNMAQNVTDYCKKGDLIGIKGRIQTTENKEVQIIAEKVTFLASKKEENDSTSNI